MRTKAKDRIVSEMIANHNVSKEELRSAIEAMGGVFEPPTFWSSMANSKDHSAEHRRLCVFQLFRRHVRNGQSLSDLAEILDRPTWLLEENVTLVERLHGKIPFSWDFETSIFSIRPGLPAANDSSIYLKLAGKQIDARTLAGSLKTGSFDEGDGEITILEIGYAETD